MKIKFITILLFLALFLVPYGLAQDESSDSGDIEQFKEKLASKVAELQKKEEKAISGFIIEIKSKQIKFKSNTKEEFTIEVDDVLTKFYSLESGSKNEITIDDLAKDDYIIVSGAINGKIITGNNIYKDVSYTSSSGTIDEVNLSDYYLKVSSFENESLTIDIESSTKRFVVNSKTYELETIGFSKIKSGDIVIASYKLESNNKKETRFSATKIIVIQSEFFNK